jgi:hypothetical protein
MDCRLQNNDERWIQCDDSRISDTNFGQELTENLFDIRVLDNQNNALREFEGSSTGTTIENLEPGTYTVEEIKHTTPENQLAESDAATGNCRTAGFTDGGGQINIPNEGITYVICFEYEEDEQQNNDCRTITLAAGESRTCTVKNYIISALDRSP